MPQPWPPPPDLASIQELVRAADPEGYLAEGAPADEYDAEEKAAFAALRHLHTVDLVAARILPSLEQVWAESAGDGMDRIRPALLSLAKEIERFFGPESKPRTRAQILAGDEPGSAA